MAEVVRSMGLHLMVQNHIGPEIVVFLLLSVSMFISGQAPNRKGSLPPKPLEI